MGIQMHQAMKALSSIKEGIKSIREMGFDVNNLSRRLRQAEWEILYAIDAMKGKEEEDREKNKIVKRETQEEIK